VDCVGAFHDGDAWVLTECVVECAVGGVDGDDVGGASPEKAIGESADVTTEVGGCFIGYVKLEVVEGEIEFESASADEW